MRAYAPVMSIRKLLFLLVAVAFLIAPALTRAGEARAAVASHQMEMMEPGHCTAPPSDSGDHDRAPVEKCCMSICMGIAIASPPPVGTSDIVPVDAVSPIPNLHLSYLGEIATPPPRMA